MARSAILPPETVEIGVTRAQLFPRLGLQGQGGRQRAFDTIANPVPRGGTNPYSDFALDLGVSWELDLWGKLRRATEAARMTGGGAASQAGR